MKYITISSKTYGTHKIILDAAEHTFLTKQRGKIFFSKKRGNLYAQKIINGKIMELQRFIMNPPKGKYVDHINHNTLDNRRSNLRICSNADNLRNGKVRPNNTSGCTGVYYRKTYVKKKWAAEIVVHYKKIFLGGFEKFEDAAKAREKANTKYFTTK